MRSWSDPTDWMSATEEEERAMILAEELDRVRAPFDDEDYLNALDEASQREPQGENLNRT